MVIYIITLDFIYSLSTIIIIQMIYFNSHRDKDLII